LQTLPADHCFDAHSLIIRRKNAGAIVYTGDSRPVPLLAQEAKHAQVLIHEATFEEDMIEEAKSKRHSTVKEAIDMANLMKAKCLVLTHFSQR
jgi:ribonuclease Z